MLWLLLTFLLYHVCNACFHKSSVYYGKRKKKGKKATADSGQNLATCSYKRDWEFDALLLRERQAKEKEGGRSMK